MATSTPSPSEDSSLMADTTSSTSLMSIVSDAPNSWAVANRNGLLSTAMIRPAPRVPAVMLGGEAVGQPDESGVGVGHPHGLGLGPVDPVAEDPADSPRF